MQLFPKTNSGMAGNVDPDKTDPSAVWWKCALFEYTISSDNALYEVLKHLP